MLTLQIQKLFGYYFSGISTVRLDPILDCQRMMKGDRNSIDMHVAVIQIGN